MTAQLKLGDRVYLVNGVAGEPGIVIGFDRGKALVEWPDLDIGHPTKHAPESMILADALKMRQSAMEFAGEEVAA